VTVAPSFGFGYPGEKSPGVGEKTRAGGGLFLVEIEEDSSNWGSACLAGLNKCNTFGPKQQEENNTMTTKFIFPRMAAAKVFPGAVFAVRFFRPQGDPNAN